MARRPWHEVTIRTTDEERELFQAAARELGMPVATWVRSNMLRIARQGIPSGQPVHAVWYTAPPLPPRVQEPTDG